tara:strand:- start:506 stop:676 length:171 start_codon:yes stop_codon:yes gene_type:complete
LARDQPAVLGLWGFAPAHHSDPEEPAVVVEVASLVEVIVSSEHSVVELWVAELEAD